MNGIALLLIAATLGVEYDWQTTDDGQIEYVLIVEPDFLTSLAEGSEIRSTVPPELESVQRLCIRIAQPAKNGVAPQQPVARKLAAESFRTSRIGLRAAEPTTIFWTALGQPAESQNVKYGWQPTKEGLQEYFVQIEPKFLRTLRPGDEIYTQLSAEAGRTDTFVVFSNAKQLPKVPGRPVAAPPTAGLAAAGRDFPGPLPGAPGSLPAAPGAATTPPSFGPPAFSAPGAQPPATFGPAASFGPPSTSGASSPPFSPARQFGVTDDTGLDPTSSRVNPATGYEPAPAPYSPPATGYTSGSLPGAAGTSRPNLNSGYNQPDSFGNNGLRNQPGVNDPYRRDQTARNPQQGELYPAGNYNNSFASNTPGTNPPLGSAPYRPGVGGYPPDNTNPSNPYLNPPMNPPQLNSQPGFNDPRMQPPTTAIDYRPTSNDQLASVPNNNSLRPSVRDDLRTNPNTPVVPAEKPWWPFVFVAFGLFISIGANLYLGWTAAEFYSRYRLAVERLRTSGR